ncbi:hypothetical protein UPYG_G00044100 [Umbra pygmaea]|uniref:C2H2-type domain-containing protein n=1 Tax=Umbra pygmaea TaxID=75934 RepID=A0ABD0XQN1_UMBPY
MSEILVLSFQTQLSGVMETVLKSAMYEITRLVEDGFLEEVRRGQQEVTRSHKELESLRTLLQLAESKLKDGSRRTRCADCGRTAVHNEEMDERPPGTQNSVPLLSGCDLKLEEDPEAMWRSCGQETVDSSQEAPRLAPPTPPAPSPQFVGSLKEEEEAVLEPWRMKVNTQPSTAQVYTEEQRDSHTQPHTLVQSARDAIEFPPGDPEAKQITQTHRLAGSSPNHVRGLSIDSDRPTRASPLWPDHRMLDTDVGLPSNLQVVRDQPPSSEPTEMTQQARDAGYLAIKQEIILDSDVGEEEEEEEEEEKDEEGVSSSVGRYRVRPDNYNTHRSLGQEVMKLTGSFSKVDTGLEPQAATPQPNQSFRKHPHIPPANPSSAVSASSSSTSCHVFNNLNYRIPSKYKLSPQSLPRMRAYRDAAKRGGYIPYNRGTSHGGLAPATSQTATQQQGSQLQLHHPARLALRCPVCGKVFPHPSNLKAHQQTHTGERPFVCALCGRSFTKLSNLKAHRRVHTGERPYSCSDCGKRFTQKCNLKRHQRIHMENDI